eukprot:TRINITY_DN20527_c0_g2_i1.p1 TRINITY_DN20527_c0_g2~~TRINITY_DN20527_c0_g2_i1.p1  ORF type:complete len:375 (+),score=137.41 TRINITY_DN20527_c0_g2_i1:94-1125(+)
MGSTAPLAGKPPLEALLSAARSVASFIEDPKNNAVKDELLRTQGWKMPELISHVIFLEGPQGSLWGYRGGAAKVLADGLAENQENPVLVQVLHMDSRTVCVGLGDVVSPQIAVKAAVEAADYLEFLKNHDQENHHALLKVLIGSGEWGSRKKFSTMLAIFRSLRDHHPNSIFKSVPEESIPILAKILMEFSHMPEVRKHRKRAALACVSREFVVAVQRDIHDFLTSDLQRGREGDDTGIARGIAAASLPESKTPQAFRMRFLQSHGQAAQMEEVQVDLLLTIAGLPGSRITDFEDDPELVNFLRSTFTTFEKDPEVQELHGQIAAAVAQWAILAMQQQASSQV